MRGANRVTGFRAALFHIGVLARLAESDLLRHVSVIPTLILNATALTTGRRFQVTGSFVGEYAVCPVVGGTSPDIDDAGNPD